MDQEVADFISWIKSLTDADLLSKMKTWMKGSFSSMAGFKLSFDRISGYTMEHNYPELQEEIRKLDRRIQNG
jgi:hypothetical protein